MCNHCTSPIALRSANVRLCDDYCPPLETIGIVGLGASSARRQPQTIQAGLLDLAPCTRHRMRELCQATHDVCEDALKTIIRVRRQEHMKGLCP